MSQATHYRDFLCNIFGLCFVLAYILDDLDCVMTFALLVESVHNNSGAPPTYLLSKYVLRLNW